MTSHVAAQVTAEVAAQVAGRIAEDRRDCYWLYIVTNCADYPTLQEPVRDPARFPWHQVTKVAHYWLEVNAMTRPMVVREDSPKYGSDYQ
ncbi:MAG: hypothetical protein JW893_02695 [Candidatus Omnitrophica bacterium]|nr:hypothetical protein [Candidatus Omnitrophota bacterium]